MDYTFLTLFLLKIALHIENLLHFLDLFNQRL